jgi:ferredoxin/flavodoxin---NADP+ reductase
MNDSKQLKSRWYSIDGLKMHARVSQEPPHAPDVVLVHGVRQPEHLGYREELRALQTLHPLRYVPVVSRSTEASSGGEVRGRITSCLADGSLEAAAERRLTPVGQHVMLCGNPEMIQDMLKLLEGRGLTRHRQRKPGHVTFEKYW